MWHLVGGLPPGIQDSPYQAALRWCPAPDHPIALGLVGLLGPPIITTVATLPDGPVERTPYEIEYKFRAHLGLVIDGGIIPLAPANIIARIDVPDINRESEKTVALFT